jgi:transcription elongation factor Elf1
MEIENIIKNSKNLSGVMKMINNNPNLLNRINDLTNYLDDTVSIYERLFNIKYNLDHILICPICKHNKLEWNMKYKKYKKTCNCKSCKLEYLMLNRDLEKEMNRRKKISDVQKNKSDEEKKMIRDKIVKTNLEKYGVDSFAKSDLFKDNMKKNKGYVSPFELNETHKKSKKTLMKKYGVDHNFKIDAVKNNKKNTFLIKYGVDVPTKCDSIKNKIIDTNNIKYGGNSPMNNIDIVHKAKETYKINYIDNDDNKKSLLLKRENTMLEKYGVKYWMQNCDNADNMTKKTSYKKYILNNKEYSLQGYEDFALFNILLKKYNINDIKISNSEITANIGNIYYTYNNKKHRYYPDFFICSKNKIYEVKSNYTYNCDLEKNKLKEQACLNAGINFEFIIINKQTYKDWINININIK